jgi:cytochrome c oxidase cbb3-type subunit 4
MDLNEIRIAVTIAAIVAFVGIVWWAYRPASRSRFERDGRSILEDHEP